MSYGCAASSKYSTGAATTVAYASPALLTSAVLTAAGAAATLVIYDNASAASGTIVATVSVAANSSQWVDFSFPIMCNNGITFITTGTGAQANVQFVPGA